MSVQLRNDPQEEEQLISVRNIVLNRENHQVFKDDLEVHHTKREFDLFEYLLQKKGKVCERIEIIQQVWNIYFDYDTSIIDVYINGLRKKLDLGEQENHIQTIRGVGYIVKD